MEFYQQAPTLTNTYESDSLLKLHLKKVLPADVEKSVSAHLRHVGELAVGDWLRWSAEAEAQPPVLVPYDPWGHRLDEIRLSEGWKKLEAAASTEGLVASAYERTHGEWSRVYQAALLYLFHPSSAFVSCPLAMTDGAARAIELYGDEALKAGALRHLTSRDPKTFWTSGQWMTERSGGSDVSGTETIARKNLVGDFEWSLSGVKWFTSATTSQMAMLLARPEGAEAGNRGLSLFYVETKTPDGRLKDIEILRLKDKMGTKALPTAELRLRGTPAKLVGGEGHGVRKISSLFNVTRVYNSICATGHARRALDLAWAYARVRSAFGKKLMDHPLHKLTLDRLEADFVGCFQLTFFVAHLLGRDECGVATASERVLLRALTPIAKLWTAKKNVEICAEVVEAFGGAGTVEDTGVAKYFRDAPILAIWEGTTNVLALDFLRALEKEGAGPVLLEFLKTRGAAFIEGAGKDLFASTMKMMGPGVARETLEAHARDVAFGVAQLVIGSLASR